MQQDFKPNSNKAKEQKESVPVRKFQKVVSGEAKRGKGNIFKRLVDTFIIGDIDNLGGYILLNVVIPTVKNAVEDVFLTLWRGDPGKRRSGGTVGSWVSYRENYVSGSKEAPKPERFALATQNYDNVTFDTRDQALSVLYAMEEALERYKTINIAAFYDLSGISDDNYAMNQKYGWMDLSGADVVRTYNGRFKIKFPKAGPLD